jgi:hypothetical protein
MPSLQISLKEANSVHTLASRMPSQRMVLESVVVNVDDCFAQDHDALYITSSLLKPGQVEFMSSTNDNLMTETADEIGFLVPLENKNRQTVQVNQNFKSHIDAAGEYSFTVYARREQDGLWEAVTPVDMSDGQDGIGDDDVDYQDKKIKVIDMLFNYELSWRLNAAHSP